MPRIAPFAVSVSLGLCLVLAAHTESRGELVVRLKNGQSLSLPVDAADVQSIEFTTAPVPPPLTTNPVTASPAAQPAQAPAKTGVIRVAPDSAIKSPSAAAAIAKDGDVIEIAAALYRGDVAVWTQNNLTLRGVGGRAHVEAGGRSAEGKAIWVIRGNNVRVENMEFSGARVADRNGAGIRSEGAGLIIENSYFHDNDMGLLSSPNPDSDIIIRNSEFSRNYLVGDAGSSIGHNVYIGAINSLTMSGSKVHGAIIGHNVKSRARVTTLVDNDIYDGPDGRSSYLVDLPAGGVATLRNNRLHRGPDPENISLVSYGAEQLIHGENRLVVTGNSFVNDHRTGIFIHNHAGIPAEITGNEFKGPGAILRGSGSVISRR